MACSELVRTSMPFATGVLQEVASCHFPLALISTVQRRQAPKGLTSSWWQRVGRMIHWLRTFSRTVEFSLAFIFRPSIVNATIC
jgi:hypothetical protein